MNIKGNISGSIGPGIFKFSGDAELILPVGKFSGTIDINDAGARIIIGDVQLGIRIYNGSLYIFGAIGKIKFYVFDKPPFFGVGDPPFPTAAARYWPKVLGAPAGRTAHQYPMADKLFSAALGQWMALAIKNQQQKQKHKPINYRNTLFLQQYGLHIQSKPARKKGKSGSMVIIKAVRKKDTRNFFTEWRTAVTGILNSKTNVYSGKLPLNGASVTLRFHSAFFNEMEITVTLPEAGYVITAVYLVKHPGRFYLNSANALTKAIKSEPAITRSGKQPPKKKTPANSKNKAVVQKRAKK
ncbi:MAG: hypothetical protein JNM68_13820 [Dinghuibacter sp.]|nr:hypothetical protein [Dinghuibacter sp.]